MNYRRKEYRLNSIRRKQKKKNLYWGSRLEVVFGELTRCVQYEYREIRAGRVSRLRVDAG